MSLTFSFAVGMCFHTLEIIDELNSQQNNTSRFLKYDCGMSDCDALLTGPSWTTSLKLAIYIRAPKMRQGCKGRNNSLSMPILRILKIFFGPFHPILSDNVHLPYVYQIAHKDTCLSHAMRGLVISDDDKGIQFLSNLREEMERNGICLAFVNVILDNMQLYMTRAGIYDKQIMTSSA
ncbi:hypothetical protein A6R68_15872, partial [Neotoma lepida]